MSLKFRNKFKANISKYYSAISQNSRVFQKCNHHLLRPTFLQSTWGELDSRDQLLETSARIEEKRRDVMFGQIDAWQTWSGKFLPSPGRERNTQMQVTAR